MRTESCYTRCAEGPCGEPAVKLGLCEHHWALLAELDAKVARYQKGEAA